MSEKIRYNEEIKLNETLKKVRISTEYLLKSKSDNLRQLKFVGDDSNRAYVIMNYLKMIEKKLSNNEKALNSPYFSRIDYYDNDYDKDMSLYIGKHGIEDIESNTITVDWRAPIASLYYECQPGHNVIETIDSEQANVDLKLKRTYEISSGRLLDFYDANTITNDELLTKYLAKNKEAVLTDIVATIQKDQNRIIRDAYQKNIIVQGGAGSGKTTVAMHRVSYLLYNFKDKFTPENFYILGSNKMFLNYITGILPSLDVEEIKNMVLQTFFESFIKKYIKNSNRKISVINKDEYIFDIDKNSTVLLQKYFEISSSDNINAVNDNNVNKNTNILKTYSNKYEQLADEMLALKGKIGFVKALETFLQKYEHEHIKIDDVIIKNRVVMSKKNIKELLRTFEQSSMQDKISILNDQLINKMKMIEENLVIVSFKEERKIYKNYFGDVKQKIDLVDVYISFLDELKQKFGSTDKMEKNAVLTDVIKKNIECGKVDLFDLAMLNLICKRLCSEKSYDKVAYIVVDEAQDFGVSIFYVLKKVFDKAYFSIMGDVAQNINYDIGMNDWEALTKKVFNEKNDVFCTLSKSYRNTLQISNVALNILNKAEFKIYPIDPFARIGKEVEINKKDSFDEMIKYTAESVKKVYDDGFETVGVICKTQCEANKVSKALKRYFKSTKVDIVDINVIEMDENNSEFASGIMVLPVKLSKGLEFDAVILWNVNEESYECKDKDIKLLYVAVTRALHELYICYNGNISQILDK